eukprot:7511150-Pyramimonas_sp.AAC.1
MLLPQKGRDDILAIKLDGRQKVQLVVGHMTEGQRKAADTGMTTIMHQMACGKLDKDGAEAMKLKWNVTRAKAAAVRKRPAAVAGAITPNEEPPKKEPKPAAPPQDPDDDDVGDGAEPADASHGDEARSEVEEEGEVDQEQGDDAEQVEGESE